MRIAVPVAAASAFGAAARAQARTELITESAISIGRGGGLPSNDSFLAGAVALADGGLRRIGADGRGLGLSVVAGRDFPNEATLLGVRGRVSRERGRHRWELSLAVR